MAGIDTSILGANVYYGLHNGGLSSTSANDTSSLSSLLDSAKISKQQAQDLVDSYKSNQTTVKSLKADTASYLDQYILSMKTLDKNANAVRLDNLDKLLKDKATGEVTDDTVAKTVKAVQTMVDSYNDTMKLLNDNADRGTGTVKQLARMVTDPAPKEGMEMLGVTVNDDGTLKLDQTKLTEALKTTDKNQLNFYKDLLGGFGGLADGIHQDAARGLEKSAQSLIDNDLANIQTRQNEGNPFKELYNSIKGGAYILNSQAATGMLLNMLA